MGLIEQDGYEFEVDWIDDEIAKLLDNKMPWAMRRYRLVREIAEHKAAMEKMPETMPTDREAMAIAKVYLARLEAVLKELDYRARTRPSPAEAKKFTEAIKGTQGQ